MNYSFLVIGLCLVFWIGVLLGLLLQKKSDDKGNESAEVICGASPKLLKVGQEASRKRADGLLVVAGVVAGFTVAIGYGFKISGNPTPVAVANAYVPGIVVLLVVMGIVIRRTAQNWHYRRGDPTSTPESQHWKAERQRFLEELAADPLRSSYLARIERGEHWSTERIAYDQDSDALATCEHLQAIERALREADIQVRLQWTKVVGAACMINVRALMQQFDLAPWVAYTEPQQYDRSAEGLSSASISCSSCGSRIYSVHRVMASSDTPTWPSDLPATGQPNCAIKK